MSIEKKKKIEFRVGFPLSSVAVSSVHPCIIHLLEDHMIFINTVFLNLRSEPKFPNNLSFVNQVS